MYTSSSKRCLIFEVIYLKAIILIQPNQTQPKMHHIGFGPFLRTCFKNIFLSIAMLISVYVQAQDNAINIGVVTECESATNQQFVDRILAEVRVLLDNYVVVVEAENFLSGDCSA